LSGMSGFYRRRKAQRFKTQLQPGNPVWRHSAEMVPRWRPFWTPGGLQRPCRAVPSICKSLTNLVGLPRFELGTSCTPNSGSAFVVYTDLRVLFGLHGFGASASAHRRWPKNQLLTHILTHGSLHRAVCDMGGRDSARSTSTLIPEP
jgi:hypothetical protein